ncbi:glycosyltransferase [Qipengyuania sphaerica]|uniref:glycosyltransferase n=1 Tax=Qipengyuania sphaerica TaxID=2867243 RepID=UPI001C86E972|nr:glycosyltransferase [Qipengyuania sphaerica]MBX7540931.1 glycosyltransferase [Qipengyuania sphaerica]
MDGRLPQVAILFSQFAGYHVDRVEAAARRLAGRAEVLAVEYATTSETYAWERPGEVAHARHVTLFPGRSYETLGAFEKYRAAMNALRGADMVCVGVPYSERDIIALSWRLAAAGKTMVMMTDSKFDDKPRSVVMEAAKARLLKPYKAAIVAGVRQREYVRFLGFGDKPVMPGYDTIDLERVRKAAGSEAVRWEDRDFLYVGRFVGKKNLPVLLEGYARYRELAGRTARGLVMAGDGELAGMLKSQAGDGVSFTGFLKAGEVAQAMARALALCLVSTEEQWGLVVNEASALGIPAIVSTPVGARDALIRNGVTGHVVDPHAPEEIARAMLALSQSEQAWQRFKEETAARAPLGDVEHFADAVEALFDPAGEAVEKCEALWSAMEDN